MGAPVSAFDRIASTQITIHSPVLKPDVVLILDETLIESVNMVQGLDEKTGVLIVNTPDSKEETKKRVSWNGEKLVTIDASKIAQANIGKPIPNTPMIGALIGATHILPIEAFMEDTKKKLEKKFKSKPEVIEGNLKAIRQAYEEVNK
jgi:pyruvate ferredoxin oxidoreductase gamma subunit